jgi:hypothetical protein
MEGQDNLFLSFEITQADLFAGVRWESEGWSLLPYFCCHLTTSISTVADLDVVYDSICWVITKNYLGAGEG